MEEDAFWLLDGLLEQFNGYFAAGFPSLLRDTEILNAMLAGGGGTVAGGAAGDKGAALKRELDR